MRNREAGFLQRLANCVKFVRRREYLERICVGTDVIGARVEREFEQLVFVDCGFLDSDYAALFKHPADASGLAEIAATPRKDKAQFRDGAISIVREHLDHYRDPSWPVALVSNLVEGRAAEFAGALL